MPRKYRVKRHAVTQPRDPSYKIIPLTKRQNALVDTADFEWLNQWNWTALPNSMGGFYAKRRSSGIYMHRLILDCNKWEQADHRNHDTLDNRRSNLRRAVGSQNHRNQKIRSNNRSGFKGVSWDKVKNKWYASIRIHGKTKALGFYRSKEIAARVYDEAAKSMFGEFAHLNFQ